MHITNRYSSLMGSLAVLTALLGIAACNQNTTAPTADKSAPQPTSVIPSAPGSMPGAPGSMPAVGGSPYQAAGLAWTLPKSWEVEGARQMRIATYRIHAIVGDPEDGECAVFFFGTGQGGTVEANLDRWAHQFTSADGQSAAAAKTDSREIAGLKVSTLTVSGTYLGGGSMMTPQQVKKPNFRMRAAIVEAPQGLLFFKLTGPLNTVSAAESDFNSLLQSLHRQ